jgi:hypothetical protein
VQNHPLLKKAIRCFDRSAWILSSLVTSLRTIKDRQMRKNDPISVLFAASVTALAFWISATLVTPALSFVFLMVGAAPAQMNGVAAKSDHGMLLAMIVPLGAAALGFFGGVLIAFIYNVVIADARPLKATREYGRKEPKRLFPTPVPALAQRMLEPQAVLVRNAVGR